MSTGTRSKLGYFISVVNLALILALFVWAAIDVDVQENEMDRLTFHTVTGEYRIGSGAWIPLEEGIPSGTERVSIRCHLAEDANKGDSFFIRVNNLSMSFYLNGEKLAGFGEKWTMPAFTHSPGMTIITLDNYALTTEDQIDLLIQNPYTGYRKDAIQNQLNSFFVSGPTNTKHILMSQMPWFSIFFNLGLIVAGFYSVITILVYLRHGFVDTHKDIPKLMAFSFFSWAAGLYIVGDLIYDELPLVIGNPIVCNLIDIIPVYLLSCCIPSYFLNNLDSKEAHASMTLLTLGVYFVTAGCLVVQLTGRWDLHEMQFIPMTCCMLTSFMALVMLYYEVRKYNNKDARFVLLTFTPIILVIVIEAISFVIHPFSANQLLFRVAMIATAWLQVIRLIDVNRSQAKQSVILANTQHELSEARIAMMMSQIQPHFLYNALNTIQFLCTTDSEKAAQTVERFAKYLRGNMDSLTQTEPIPLSQEIKHLENYLAIERLRFPDISFVYKLSAPDFAVPPLSIQPLVENSIRYGVRALEEGGTITIESWSDEENNYVCVSDNGVGFDINQKKTDGRSHVGMQNIKSRVASMCGGHVDIESTIGVGTKSTISIPKGGKD